MGQKFGRGLVQKFWVIIPHEVSAILSSMGPENLLLRWVTRMAVDRKLEFLTIWALP